MSEWDLISRPVGTLHFVYHGVGTLTRLAGLMNTQLDRLAYTQPHDHAAIDELRRQLARRVVDFRSGDARDAWCPVVAGREFCLARHDPTLYAVIEERSPGERGQPLSSDTEVYWFTRITHDGWHHWSYLWETGRFHHNPSLWHGLRGADADLEMVPISLTEFRSRLARHPRRPSSEALTWASATVERCAPELLLDGPLPSPRM